MYKKEILLIFQDHVFENSVFSMFFSLSKNQKIVFDESFDFTIKLLIMLLCTKTSCNNKVKEGRGRVGRLLFSVSWLYVKENVQFHFDQLPEGDLEGAGQSTV